MSDNSDGIIWEDPEPKSHRAPGQWAGRLTPLMKHPKRWALVRECKTVGTATSVAYNLRHRIYSYPAGKWEFAQRKLKVYARYMGK